MKNIVQSLSGVKLTRSFFLYILLLIAILIHSVFASLDPYTAVSSYFAGYDKELEKSAWEARKTTSLIGTEKMFKQMIKESPSFTYLLRTNSKGKIVAKVNHKGVEPRNFRFIGKQSWYKVISMTNKPYYGIVRGKKGYSLFWNKPIPVKTKNGSRFGGSISAKINLKESFKDIAKKDSVKFTVKLGRKVLFSNLSHKGKELKKLPLSINGFPVLTLIYENKPATFKVDGAAKAVASAGTKKTSKVDTAVTNSKMRASVKNTPLAKKTKGKGGKKKNIKSKTGKQEAEGYDSIVDDTLTDQTEAKGGNGIIIFLVLLFSVASFIGAVIVLIRHSAEKRRKLLEAIDRGEL